MIEEKENERIDAQFNAAYHEGQSVREKAKTMELPLEPMAWISEYVNYASNLPDSMPHKAVMQRQARQAIKNLKRNNVNEAKFHMLQIQENWNNAEHDLWVLQMDKRDSKEKTGGGNGGKAPKRRKWAEEMAQTLVGETEAAPNKKAWEWLAGNSVPYVFELNMSEHTVYVDGDKLVGVCTDTGKESTITKEVFLKTYYRPARKGGY